MPQQPNSIIMSKEDQLTEGFDCSCGLQNVTVSMIACDGGQNCKHPWVHFKCAGVTGETVETVDKYYCIDCRGPTKKTSFKDNATYTIEKILDHIQDEGGVEYKVKFEGLSVEYFWWYLEDDMKGEYELVDEYNRMKGLPPTRLRPIGGASASTSMRPYNQDIWVSTEEIREAIKHLGAQLKYCTDIPIITSQGEHMVVKQDAIIVILRKAHFYVGLYFKEKDQLFMADGDDKIVKDHDIKVGIENLLGKSITPLMFGKHTRIDQCGSAAVAIGLDLLRTYKTGGPTGNRLGVSRAVWDRIVQRLRQGESVEEVGRRSIQELKQVHRCYRCQATKKNRTAIVAHQRKCTVEL